MPTLRGGVRPLRQELQTMSLWLPSMSILLQQYPDEHERALPRMSETLR